MAQELKVTVDLANQKVQFIGAARSNPPVTFDYDPPLGDGQGYTGLEGLLMSLAACGATAIRLSEESICPVWAMLKGNVEIRTAFEIRKP